MFAPGLPEGREVWPFAGSWQTPRTADAAPSTNAGHWLALASWVAHFVRRFAETTRASYRRTRPLYELGASAWYAFISAYQGWSLRPGSCVIDLTASKTVACVGIGTALFIAGELGNAVHHAALARLRSARTDAKQKESGSLHAIPRGGLFEFVSMPHYFCEIIAFVGYTLLAPTLASGLFLLASALNLVPRALEAHRRYRHEFHDDYPRDRKALVPWLL